MKKLIWLALGLLPGGALAEDMVIYRCTGPSSDVPTLQRTPCPAGSRQAIQRLPAAAATPAPEQPPAPAPAAPPSPAPAAKAPPRAGEERIISEARMVDEGDAILDSALLPRGGRTQGTDDDGTPKPPLPPIFQCMDSQGGAYLHEYEPAPGRCELLNVQGLGGSTTPANAASCEVVSDRCTELEEGQRCGSWQQRFRDARGRERFAAPENRDGARIERERVQAVLAASACPVPQ